MQIRQILPLFSTACPKTDSIADHLDQHEQQRVAVEPENARHFYSPGVVRRRHAATRQVPALLYGGAAAAHKLLPIHILIIKN